MAISWHLAAGGNVFEPGNIRRGNFVVNGTNRNHTIGFGAEDMGAINTQGGFIHLVTAHALGLAKGTIDRLSWALQMHNGAFAHAGIAGFTHTNNVWYAL